MVVGLDPTGEGGSYGIESGRHCIAPEGFRGNVTLKHKVAQMSSTGDARKKSPLFSACSRRFSTWRKKLKGLQKLCTSRDVRAPGLRAYKRAASRCERVFFYRYYFPAVTARVGLFSRALM